MLLQLTTTHSPATDLGFLLGKNPARCQTFDLPFGKARVFYPEASAERCTAALLVEVDPVGLVRTQRRDAGGGLDQYVNDRPYAASSFLSVALASVFGSALGGRSRERPDLTGTALPLEATLSAVPARGGEGLLRRLFEPLGYTVMTARLPLDPQFPDWGDSPYYRLTLSAERPLREFLSHLYVLLPVLDNDKHYWVGDDEVEKLLRHGGDWLAAHPERDLIARRYLKHSRALTNEALAQLADGDEAVVQAAEAPPPPAGEENSGFTPENTANPETPETAAVIEVPEKGPTLNEQRLASVLAVLKASGAARVLDLGCGEGKLLKLLLKEKQFTSITGMDVAHRTLEIATERLHLDRLSEAWQKRIQLIQGSLIYRDDRLAGADAAAVVEVIEHLDPPRLAAFERVVFGCAKPGTVVITTPNREYNVKWETLPAGKFRHRDHRFEWTRAEFQAWSARVAAAFGYEVQFRSVGPEDPEIGSPTQMGIFRLLATALPATGLTAVLADANS
ncbi:MAG: 3' terminal RNA ribose 2'-O-methyltransferase Hen1 [Verrucomicrobiota bacterium]